MCKYLPGRRRARGGRHFAGSRRRGRCCWRQTSNRRTPGSRWPCARQRKPGVSNRSPRLAFYCYLKLRLSFAHRRSLKPSTGLLPVDLRSVQVVFRRSSANELHSEEASTPTAPWSSSRTHGLARAHVQSLQPSPVEACIVQSAILITRGDED